MLIWKCKSLRQYEAIYTRTPTACFLYFYISISTGWHYFLHSPFDLSIISTLEGKGILASAKNNPDNFFMVRNGQKANTITTPDQRPAPTRQTLYFPKRSALFSFTMIKKKQDTPSNKARMALSPEGRYNIKLPTVWWINTGVFMDFVAIIARYLYLYLQESKIQLVRFFSM